MPAPQTLPGLGQLMPTKASMPVWSGSLKNVRLKYDLMTKKDRTIRYAMARQWDLATTQPGRHGGALGRSSLLVYYALCFTFYNFETGRLDPSYSALQAATGLARSTVAAALKTLRAHGLITWVRRCSETYEDGRFMLKQETNAYSILPMTSWKGGTAPPARAAAPEPGTWGEPAPRLDPLGQYDADRALGISQQAALAALESHRIALENQSRSSAGGDRRSIESALAALGHAVLASAPSKHPS